MTERAKKIWDTIGWEFFFLLAKLFVLALLIIPAGMIFVCAALDGSKWGQTVACVTTVTYFALVFFAVVWWPFHKYVYSRFTRRTKAWLWSAFGGAVVVAGFALFSRCAVDDHSFQAGKQTFRVVIRDTYWNRIFRSVRMVPDYTFRDYDVTIYTAKNEKLGNYSCDGSEKYTVPHYFIDKEGTPVTHDGGYDLYLEDPEVTKLRHRKPAPAGKWQQMRRQLHRRFLEDGVTNNTMTILPLPCSGEELHDRIKELSESRFKFHATVSTDGTNLIIACPADIE